MVTIKELRANGSKRLTIWASQGPYLANHCSGIKLNKASRLAIAYLTLASLWCQAAYLVKLNIIKNRLLWDPFIVLWLANSLIKPF